MRRRLLLTAGLALVAGLVVGGVSFAHGEGTGIEQKIVLTFLEVEDKIALIDVGDRAQGEQDVSPGDMVVEENVLRNLANTETLGQRRVKCQNLVTPGILSCNATAILRDGTIEVAGTTDFTREEPGPLFLAVTGGTGRFKNVSGQMKIVVDVSPGTDRITFELIPSFRHP